jgi:3-oxoacyl-[acyl-carrier protein] reductase
METQYDAWPAYAAPPLAGKVAVVTGGASGIGGAIAWMLAGDGADVVISGRNTDALDEQVRALQTGFPDRGVAAIRADVTDVGEVDGLISGAVERFDGLDILINAAGGTGPIETPAQEVDPDAFRAIIDLNIVGTFLPCRAAIPHLIARGGGRIVNLSGTSGLRGYRNRVGYSSSKWAIRGMTRTLALELGPHDITVNAICPNVMNGERMTTIVAEKARKTGRTEQEVYDDFASQTALGRFVDPSDVATAARFLVSEGARNFTGHDMAVDAGWDV